LVFAYICYHCLLSGTLESIVWYNYELCYILGIQCFSASISYVENLYENLTCLLCTQLNCPENIWTVDVNGPEKFWNMYTKVLENHFSCLVCIHGCGHVFDMVVIFIVFVM